ncbi:MAG: transcriptional regulator [Planctomycetes bacterium]|nr:transcriptional regulator [Planctomycetota bacterium]
MEPAQPRARQVQKSPNPPSIVAGRVSRHIRMVNLLQSTERCTAERLARHLGVGRRTVFRDLKVLQGAGVPFVSTPGRGYDLSPDYAMSRLNLGVPAALGLNLLGKVAAAMPDQPLFGPAIEAIGRVVAQLPPAVRMVYDDLLAAVSISPGALNICPDDEQPYRTLQYCIEERMVCRFVYRAVEPWGPCRTKIHPVHLHFYKRAWYVLAFSEQHDEVRMFKLSRIEELEPSDEVFAPFHFSIDAYLDDAWGIIPEGRKYNVVLQFSDRVARNAAEVRWHKTQQSQLQPDGSCVLRFRVNGLNEIKWWIIGYGDQVVVHEPPELRNAIRAITQRILTHYVRA